MESVTNDEPAIPEGLNPSAKESWPPRDLIDSFLGNFDFEFRPGEDVSVGDAEDAQKRARQFRDVLGRFCSGVTVVTAMTLDGPVGMTCQSFSSISLEPPLVTFIPAKTSRAWPMMQRSGSFCVNFLSAHQQELSNTMASKGADKFAGVDWVPSQTGSPLLHDLVGYVDCEVFAVHEAGDHYVVIGKVVDLGVGDAEDPLLFYQGRYRSTAR